jgi:PAS domain S-box-containing protein
LFRGISYRLIASVILVLAVVVSVILLFSLEQEKLLLEGVTQGKTVVVVSALLLLVSAMGIAAVIIFLHYDNTKRTLEEVKGLARNILKSIPTGVLTVNRAGMITAVNPAAEMVLRRCSDDLLGKTYQAVFVPGDRIQDVLDGALRDHRHVRHHDLSYGNQDGSPLTIRVSTADLVGDDGQPAGVILQAQDITDWLDLEQRLRTAEKLAALHTLSAGVAHELRNPLSAMDLNLHLLEEELKEQGAVAKQGQRYLNVLNAECRRLSVILDNFMKFARPGSIGPHAVNITMVIEHIVALMEFEAVERKVRLEYAVKEPLPPVRGEETAISQVFVNILVNALHAMPNGGLCRVMAEERTSYGARWVAVSVIDAGIGMKKEQLSRVFEPFYTTKASGTGLGLAIAHRIVQDHGGSIQISSMPGIGTTVVVMFPVAATQSDPAAAGL